ncbi:MAG: hypothetical protein LBE38_06655 [Deltaproteobacteria bacterium]|nr:hypothetical protein [Deltaproteobacteria bacterium]
MTEPISQWKTRRQLLEGKVTISSADFVAKAKELIACGYLAAALEFLQKADDKPELANFLQLTIGEGDFFLSNLCVQALGRDFTSQELKLLAENAQEKGFILYYNKTLNLANPNS